MSVFTVYEPPLRAADELANPARFVFVRDGFYWWAFLLTPLWMLRHGLWLVFVIYLAGSILLVAALLVGGASTYVIVLVTNLVSYLIGMEAGTLRRFTLKRRHWRDVGVVGGSTLEAAERRFFEDWMRQSSGARAGKTAAAPVGPAVTGAMGSAAAASGPSGSRGPDPSKTDLSVSGSVKPERFGVIGHFPEPGA